MHAIGDAEIGRDLPKAREIVTSPDCHQMQIRNNCSDRRNRTNQSIRSFVALGGCPAADRKDRVAFGKPRKLRQCGWLAGEAEKPRAQRPSEPASLVAWHALYVYELFHCVP